MPSKNLKDLKQKLQGAASEKNLSRRGVKVAAVIAEALRGIGQDPTLVGGAAVEFYTEGGYATADIDMLAPGGPSLWEVMKQLGFARQGKDFINEPLKLYVEFPGECLGPGEKSDLLDVQGIALKIITIEDLIVDRLCAYKFWKSEIDGVAALLLLETGRAETGRLRERAQREEVSDALDWVQGLYEEIFRKKLTKPQASQRIKDWTRGQISP